MWWWIGKRVVGTGWRWAKWGIMGTSISVNNKKNSHFICQMKGELEHNIIKYHNHSSGALQTWELFLNYFNHIFLHLLDQLVHVGYPLWAKHYSSLCKFKTNNVPSSSAQTLCNISVSLDFSCQHTNYLFPPSPPYLIKSYSRSASTGKATSSQGTSQNFSLVRTPLHLPLLPLSERLTTWCWSHAGLITCNSLRTKTTLLWSMTRGRHSYLWTWVNELNAPHRVVSFTIKIISFKR